MSSKRFVALFTILACLGSLRPLSGQDEIAKQAIVNFKRDIDSSSVDEQVNAIFGMKDADCEKGASLLLDLFKEDDMVVKSCALEVLKKFRSPESVGYVINKGLKSRKAEVRQWSAVTLGYMTDPGPEATAAVAEALAKEKKPEAKAAMIRALGRFKHKEAADLILKSLNDKDMVVRMEVAYAMGKIQHDGALTPLITLLRDPVWQVRVQALESMAKFNNPDIIPVLIKRLPKENGRLREDILQKLGDMTGQDFGVDHQKWTAWWNDNEDALRKEFGKRKRRRYKKKLYADGYSYYNIATYSKSFVFIIDVSGSMLGEILPAKSYGFGLQQIPRIDLAKQELVKLINNLSEDTNFNIIYFAKDSTMWKKKLETASKRGKEEAVGFVEGIMPLERGLASFTNLYAALDMAFELVEEGVKKSGKRYSAAADTIFLLSDGVPYGPNWLTNRNAIVYSAKERNRHLKMRIHTISLAGDMETPRFLSRLSSPNGGEMKDVLKE